MRKNLLLLIFLFASFFVSAEGTKQILLVDGGHGKVQVMPGFSDFAWYTGMGNSAPAEYRLHIHIKTVGEVIYYGFGDLLDLNDLIFSIPVSYRIKNPAGTVVVGPAAVPTSGTGYISTFAQAVAGPSALAGASGYPALSFTPATTGDYFIEFNFNTGGFNPDRCKFKYFDITVGSAANTAIDGRVWSQAWQFTADANGASYDFEGTLYPYTADSVVTSVFFNGMAPFVFTIACNQYGCYNTGNFTTDRRSVGGNHIIPQYKIFLNNPDSLVYPTGILGQIIPPVTATGNCNGTVTIEMFVNKAGNVDVWLDINPAPAIQAEDVILSQAVTYGLNTFTWNGQNGLGQWVTNGTVITINVTYINGLTNLPIYDIDENPNGFIINLHRPTGPPPGVYWDDSQVSGGQNLITGCLYVLPSTGCHTVPYSIGNGNTINTWWNAVVDTSTAPIVFTEMREPGVPGVITGPNWVCPGATNVMYFVPGEANCESYVWSFLGGSGVTIYGNGNDTVYLDFPDYYTIGSLIVQGYNAACGLGVNGSGQGVGTLPSPVVTFSPFGPVCLNDPPFPLTGGTPVGGTYYIGGNPVVTFDPAAYGAGTFLVSYIYPDPVWGCTDTAFQSLTVSPVPVVTMSAIAPVCANIPAFTLTQGSPAGGVYSGPGVTGTTFDPAAAGPGNHDIVYTYTDANTCTNSDTTTVTVYAVTPVVLTPFADVCEDIPPFTLTNGSPAGGVYTGPGISGNLFDPAAAGVGTHTITYTYTNPDGCIDAESGTIMVLPLPGAPGAVTGPASLCEGTATSNFSTPPIADAWIYNWLLSPPASGAVSGNTASVTVTWTPGYTGPVQVTVNGVNGCGNGPVSAPLNLTVFPRPVVTYRTCTDSVTVTTAQPITLKGGLPLGGTYSGTAVNSGTGVFTPAAAGIGNFTIRYTYTNTYGCNAFATKIISVQAPAAFACNGLLRDIRDNRQYPTILIAGRCWMAANLNYGNNIPSIGHQLDNCIPEKYCYGDNAANCAGEGGLYQWDEVMAYTPVAGTKGLCPPAWHVPTDAEWNLLFATYINAGFAGSPLKYTGFSGFDAYLFGVGHENRTMDWPGFATMFWTSGSHGPYKAWAHGMNTINPSVSLYPSLRSNAFQVRCIRD